MRKFGPDLRNERGIALVLTIFGLVVIGAVVTGAFFVGRVEQITGNNTVWSAQATEAAEAGISAAQANLGPSTYEALTVWSPSNPQELTLSTQSLSGMPFLVHTTRIRRLTESLFLVYSTGERLASDGTTTLASQTIGSLVRLAKPTIGVNAAITVTNPIKFNGNSFKIDGYNNLPPQWGGGECDPLDPLNSDDLVGIRSATTTGAEAKDLVNISGFPVPTVDNDPTITSQTFRNYLDYTYNTLAQQANVRTLPNTSTYNGIAPVLDNTQAPPVCDKSVLLNFGEPFRNPPSAGAVTQCQDHFVVVHGTGSELKFAANSRGQGIILVDGNFEIVGGFEWVGVIIVRGQMKITGTGNKIFGAILTEGADINTSGDLGGNVEIRYSQCGIEKAMKGIAQPVTLARGWTQIF